MTGIIQRLRALVWRRRLDADLEAELAAHVELKQRHLEAEGASPEEAAARARQALGNATAWKETTRELWTFGLVEQLWRDVRYSLRVLAKDRGFTAVVLLTLTLGIGANTAIFSLINGLMWRALPVENPQQLVRLVVTNLPPSEMNWVSGRAAKVTERRTISFPLYEVIAKRQQVFTEMYGHSGNNQVAIDVAGVPHRVLSSKVTGSYFPALGVKPQIGRLLDREDDVPGGPSSGWHAVISDALWSRAFGRSSQAIGAKITVERIPFTIVGVAPPSFGGVQPGVNAEIWMPLSSLEALQPTFKWRTEAGWSMIQAMGRLRPGVSLEQAQQQISSLSRSFLEEAKELNLSAEAEKHFLAMKLEVRDASSGESWVTTTYGRVLWILLAAVVAVLLIASTNVTNLLLARSSARKQEIAIRLAIGASAARIRTQLMMESALLALGGTCCGVLFSRWLITALQRAISSRNDVVSVSTPIDITMLAFLSGTMIVVTLVCGWGPAWMASRMPVLSALKQRTPEARTIRLRGGLIVLQAALTFALLGGAGLLLSSFRALMQESTGFRTAAETVFLTPDLFNAGIDRAAQSQVYRNLLEDARRNPNVVSAAWTMIQPLSGNLMTFGIKVPGFEHLPPKSRTVYSHEVSEGYFATVGLPLLAGRDLPTELSPRRDVCVISENVARKFFRSAQEAVGQRLNVGRDERLEIIGVVADSKYNHVREPAPLTLYSAYSANEPGPGLTLAIRHTGPREPLIRAIEGLFAKQAGRVTFTRVASLGENLSDSVRTERVLTMLLAGFAAFALLITATGIAGLIAYTVQQRRKEIGIRLALGALPHEIGAKFWQRAVLLTGSGMALGGCISYALRQTVDHYLFRTTAMDPAIWVGVGIVLLGAATAAAAIPAWRAAQMNPADALRLE